MAKHQATDPQELESSILGTIFGNCIGDAIGLLTEFMVKGEAELIYGEKFKSGLEYADKAEDRHRNCWETGDWTDDSDQMILIMDSIIEKSKIDPVDYGQRLIFWARNGFPELGDKGGNGLGSTTYHVLHHKKFESKPHAAAKDIWERTGCSVAPNGAVMRTSVLGIYQYQNLKHVIKNCLDICKVTHADPRCQASCVAVCCAISFMLCRKPKYLNQDGSHNIDQIIDDSYEEAKNHIKHKEDLKALKHHMYARDLSALNLDEEGKIGYTFKSLGAGFWALRQNDFRQALTAITMEAGDADTNGAVAGALLGCKLGVKGLPKTWLEGLLHKQWLDNRIIGFLRVALPELTPTMIHYKEVADHERYSHKKYQQDESDRHRDAASGVTDRSKDAANGVTDRSTDAANAVTDRSTDAANDVTDRSRDSRNAETSCSRDH